MNLRNLTIELGAGCRAVLTWFTDGQVAIEVQNPDHKRVRGFRGPWIRSRIQESTNSELHHIVFLALRTGRCPAWTQPGFASVGSIAAETGLGPA